MPSEPPNHGRTNRTAEVVLTTVRASLGLSVGSTSFLNSEGQSLWLVNARSADGSESWTAKGEDYYATVCALAELVGFDLRDG